MSGVDVSREAVERLADEASFDGRQDCADTLPDLRAALDAAEQRAVEAEAKTAVWHEIAKAYGEHAAQAIREVSTARAAGMEEAARIADAMADFAAQGGPHSCTSINRALWYGRQQYSEEIAAAIRAAIHKEASQS